MKNANRRTLMQIALVVFVLWFLFSGCARNMMRYSPIEITPKSNQTYADLKRDVKCLAGSGDPEESSHSEGLGPRGMCGLHGFVRDQHDYSIVSGIGME